MTKRRASFDAAQLGFTFEPASAALGEGLLSGLEQLVASAVRSFLDTASDDLWTQLIGIMNRAEDPGLAAMRAILTKAFPPLSEVKP